MTWIFFFTFSISSGLCIPFLPSGGHLLSLPYTRWESLSTLLLPSSLSLSPSAYQSCLNASFYPVYSSFWNLIPFYLLIRLVSALNGLHLIKFCTFRSPFRMGLTNPGRALKRSCLLSIFLKLLTLSGILPFSTNLFRLASLLALLIALHLSFLIGTLLWSIKITNVVAFESIEVLYKDLFLALYFSLSSLMIFRPLCLLPSAALFMLMIWPFGPHSPRFLLRWRPHKELCFDWSAGLSTGVFLSIRANVRPPFSQWIPTRLTSSPTSSYLAPASVSISLQLFLGSPLTALFPFLSMYLRWRPSSSHVSKPYAVSLHHHGAPLRSPSLFCINLFFGSFSLTLHLNNLPFLSTTNFTKLERLHRATSRTITRCLSSSPIPLLLSMASLPTLRVILTHFTLFIL